MAKVALIGIYDNWALGLRTLSNTLISEGHDVSIIHFKMPVVSNQPFFSQTCPAVPDLEYLTCAR